MKPIQWKDAPQELLPDHKALLVRMALLEQVEIEMDNFYLQHKGWSTQEWETRRIWNSHP